MIIKQGGTQCNCGNQGCLEAIAGKVGIIKHIERKIEEKGKTTKLDEIAPQWRKSVGASALHKAINSKDKLVIKAVERSAEAIGVACSNVINTIGVDAVILGGGIIEELSDIYLPIIRLTIQECSMANGGSNFPVIISELGDDAVALGAAWQAVEIYGNK
jgi:glucokinase